MMLHSLRSGTLFIFGILIYIFYFEWFAYKIYGLWDFPPRPYEDEGQIRILIAADPQLLGEQQGFSGLLGAIERHDADTFVQRTFEAAFSYADPHLVLFLGDLFDEGERATDAEYERFFARFQQVFSPIVGTDMQWTNDSFSGGRTVVFLPGDNDIGGEHTPPQQKFINRFVRHFRSDTVVASGFLDLIKINYIGMTHDYRSYLGYLDKGQEPKTPSKKRLKVLLSHIPLTNGGFGQFVQSVLLDLKPRLIFSAHEHTSKLIISDPVNFHVVSRRQDFTLDKHTIYLDISDNRCYEIVVPTCSYRMGVPNPGYGYAVISRDRNSLTYGVLWSPHRLVHLVYHIFVFSFSVVIIALYFMFYRLRISLILYNQRNRGSYHYRSNCKYSRLA